MELFDYDLPRELIAQEPLADREAARLLVVHRADGRFEHKRFRDLPEYLVAGDVLVVNDSRVVPARLRGWRKSTGGQWEGLFLAEESDDGRRLWRMLAKTRGNPRPGERVALDAGGVELEVVGRTAVGHWLMRPLSDSPTFPLLETCGHVPVPMYIRGGDDVPSDRHFYQTVYARDPGSVAAPTAGLHFTERLLADLADRGVAREQVTLHVGLGTFVPVKTDDTADHVMHSEWCALSAEAAERVAAARAAGGRCVAVGTTAVRTLESACNRHGRLAGFAGDTNLFITPPYPFGAVDALVTNFHLPRSTLLMLIAAFAGLDLTLAAYRAAVAERYRFYSYGDAM
ncbi:MAG: tRNA preQ1(34) S-adenosylmethionine ribosyltransferase-isomerase QueA, partial [Planctomycetia bacterium]